MPDEQRNDYFQILVDPTGRYGLWPLHEAVPERWSPAGFVSTRQECLRHLALLWDDRGPAGPRPAEYGGPPAPITGIVRAARRHATALAVDDGRERIDYRELVARAVRLARTLVSHGVDPGDRVALCLPPGGAALVALLGAGLAGAVFLPVDEDTPVEHRDRILTATGTRLLLAGKETPPGHSDVPVLEWADDRPVDGPPLPPVNPLAPAWLRWHRTDTGLPGVLVEHRQLGALLDTLPLPPPAPGDLVAFPARARDGVGYAGVLRALTRGATVTAPAGTADPVRDRANALPEAALTCSGCRITEPLPGRLVIRCDRPDHPLRVLDEDARPPAPDGVGTLHIGGPTVARGYPDDPAATVARFLPDPFGDGGGRMFATALPARLLEHGAVEILGPP